MKVVEVVLTEAEQSCHRLFHDCLSRGYDIPSAIEWVKEHVEAADQVEGEMFWTWLAS